MAEEIVNRWAREVGVGEMSSQVDNGTTVKRLTVQSEDFDESVVITKESDENGIDWYCEIQSKHLEVFGYIDPRTFIMLDHVPLGQVLRFDFLGENDHDISIGRANGRVAVMINGESPGFMG